jgi:hypothetical protein
MLWPFNFISVINLIDHTFLNDEIFYETIFTADTSCSGNGLW